MGIKKVPFDYTHPSKRKTTDLKPELSPVPAESERPKRKESQRAIERSSKATPSTATSGKTISLRLVVKIPKQGSFQLYDEMIESGLSHKQAILGLLKRGFTDFEADLRSGKIVNSTASYEAEGGVIETTRSVDEAFVTSCKQVFDKFDVLSNRALGCQIGEAIFFRAVKM